MAFNILIVDDSSVMRKIIIKSLRMSGVPIAELYEASNGKEGLDLVNQHWIDLVIVDINMSVMNGEEMIDHLRENLETSDIPVIVVSSEGSETRVERMKNQGASFIHKPFTPETIRDTVKKVMEGSNERSI